VNILEVCGYPGGMWLSWRCVDILEVCGYPEGVWLFWRCVTVLDGFLGVSQFSYGKIQGQAAAVSHDCFLPNPFQLVTH
jgi:hypothetical protein